MQKGKICYVSSIICEFKGEFIRTLEAIENSICGGNEFDGVVYVFPEAARDVGFMKDFVKEHNVYFIKSPESNKRKKLINFIKALFSRVNKKDFLELQEIINKENVTILHSHFEEYDSLCYEVAKKNKIKLFVHYHDALIDSYKQISNAFVKKIKLLLIKWKYKKILKNADLVAVSEYCQKQLNGFLKTNKVKLITNCIDFDYIKARHSFNEKINVFGSIVTREPKGLITILEALDIFYKNKIHVLAKLICTNKTKEIILNNYSHLVENKYIEIFEPFENINNFLEQIDCYISASYFETFSYGIAESLGYGIPCIISDIESTLWATKTNNALIFKNKNSIELYEKMKELKNSGLDVNATKNSMNYMRETYKLSNLVNNVIKLYKGN